MQLNILLSNIAQSYELVECMVQVVGPVAVLIPMPAVQPWQQHLLGYEHLPGIQTRPNRRLQRTDIAQQQSDAMGLPIPCIAIHVLQHRVTHAFSHPISHENQPAASLTWTRPTH